MKTKIFKALLTIISALLISEVFFIAAHYVIVDKYQQVTDTLVSEYQLSKDTTNLVDSFHDLIQYNNDKNRSLLYTSNLDALQKLLAKLDANLTDNSSWAYYLEVKNTIETIINKVNKGFNDISAGNFSDVTDIYLTVAQENIYVKENTGNLILQELRNVEALQPAVASTKYWSELTGIALFIAIVLGCLLYALAFSAKLAGTLRRLAELSVTISSGQYEKDIDEDLMKGGGELAMLADSLNSLKIRLKDDADKIKAKDAQLVQTAKFLSGDELRAKEAGGGE